MDSTPNYRLQALAYSYKKIIITNADPSINYVEGRDSANQPIQVTFGIFNDPYVRVPAIGELWLVTRLDNNWVLHSRFESTNEVRPVSEMTSGEGRISVPSNLYIETGGELVCDFNKAANSLRGLGTGTLPGSALYGSATLDQLNAGTVNITDRFVVPLKNYLPSRNVVDGQEERYLYDAGDGIVWVFKYNNTSSSAYKWQFIGGPEHVSFVTIGTSTTGTAWFNYGGSPSLQIPYTGDYILSGGGECIASVNNMGFDFGLSVNGSVPTSTLSGYAAAKDTPISVNTTYYVTFQKGDVLTEIYRKSPLNNPAGTATFLNRWMSIKPIRVEADPTEDPEPTPVYIYTGAG